MAFPENNSCLEDLIKGSSESELNLDANSLPDIFYINISRQSSKGIRNKLSEGNVNVEQMRKVRIAISVPETDLPLELSVNSSVVFPCTECRCTQSDEFLSAEEDLPHDSFPMQFKLPRDHGKGDCIDYDVNSERYHKYRLSQIANYHRPYNTEYGMYPLSSQLTDDLSSELKQCWSDCKLKNVGIQTDVVLGADSFSHSTSHVSMGNQNSFVQPSCSKQESLIQTYNIKSTGCKSINSNLTFNVDDLTGLILKTQTNLINLQNLQTFNNFNILHWWKKFNEIHSLDESKDLISFLNILYQSYLSPVNFFLSLNGVYHDITEGAIDDQIKPNMSGELQETNQLISKISLLQEQLASLSDESQVTLRKNSYTFEQNYNSFDSPEAINKSNNTHQPEASSAVDYLSPRSRCIREELNNFIARCLNEESNHEVQNKLHTEMLSSDRKRGYSYRLRAVNGSQSLRYLKSSSFRHVSSPPIWSEPDDLIKDAE